MLAGRTINKLAILALIDYTGFSEVLSRTSAIEIPDSPADHGITGWAGIMAGVLWQARYEALAGDRRATLWLMSDEAADFCKAIDFNHDLVIEWVKKPKHRLKS